LGFCCLLTSVGQLRQAKATGRVLRLSRRNRREVDVPTNKVAPRRVVCYKRPTMNEAIVREALKKARQTAEDSVSDMAEGELKAATYQTILAQLVQRALSQAASEPKLTSGVQSGKVVRKLTGTTSRILSLLDEGFFDEPRSLAQIRETLAETGFHYRLEDLGTPLKRLVQRKQLRRSQAVIRGKKVWRYSTY
jgi:hypothetical protein